MRIDWQFYSLGTKNKLERLPRKHFYYILWGNLCSTLYQYTLAWQESPNYELLIGSKLTLTTSCPRNGARNETVVSFQSFGRLKVKLPHRNFALGLAAAAAATADISCCSWRTCFSFNHGHSKVSELSGNRTWYHFAFLVLLSQIFSLLVWVVLR